MFNAVFNLIILLGLKFIKSYSLPVRIVYSVKFSFTDMALYKRINIKTYHIVFLFRWMGFIFIVKL